MKKRIIKGTIKGLFALTLVAGLSISSMPNDAYAQTVVQEEVVEETEDSSTEKVFDKNAHGAEVEIGECGRNVDYILYYVKQKLYKCGKIC